MVGHYGVGVPVGYTLRDGDLVVEAGEGRAIDISTRGVLLETGHPLSPGMEIELSIAWPARMNGAHGLTLRVSGHTDGSRESSTVVSIQDWVVAPALAAMS